MKLIILLLLLNVQLLAQNLKAIPDANLRNELSAQGFVTNDSLDLIKTHGRLQLELINKGIENLEGLQYFEQLNGLHINNNKISRLDYLPPRLTDLFCANNAIEVIENLPKNLERLHCRNNKITTIKKLPTHLVWLDFSTNSLIQIPDLPTSLQYINYSNNPIPLNSLPTIFQKIKCEGHSQNCLPYELMNWKILNANIKDTALPITGMTIKLSASHGWEQGTTVEEINFKINKKQLVADQMKVFRDHNELAYPNKKDESYIKKMKYKVEVSDINQLLKDIYLNKMVIEIQVGDSVKSINLKNKKNGSTCSFNCSDCTYYNLQYSIYSKSDSITLNYTFDSFLSSGVAICQENGMEDLRAILNWLYIYKLTNMTFYKHETTIKCFNRKNLERIALWAK